MGLRRKCNGWVKGALVRSELVKLAAQVTGRKVAIHRYRSVRDAPDLFARSIGVDIIHSTSAFREQMEVLARHFDTVSLDDILLFVVGQKKMPKRPVAVTFDDCFVDNFEIAAPVLTTMGLRRHST